MTTWPYGMKVAPIREWPGQLTAKDQRKPAPFRAGLTDTLKILDREIYNLADTGEQQDSAELLVAMSPANFRLDGRPRADARPEHPGVIFSMEARVGRLSYPCDTFTDWQDNLRAIALALEALRKVDRYGVTKRGEQYRGFLAIEATAAPAGWATAEQALGFLIDVAYRSETFTRADQPSRILRAAQRVSHPDAGGDPSEFQRVSLAEAKLREAGLL